MNGKKVLESPNFYSSTKTASLMRFFFDDEKSGKKVVDIVVVACVVLYKLFAYIYR
jgi:hypothetical protein